MGEREKRRKEIKREEELNGEAKRERGKKRKKHSMKANWLKSERE
jgi:hypothetical protein